MIRSVMCIVVLVMVCHAALGDDPSRAEESSYTFAFNGKPFEPYVISLGGDPDHPQPGDLICVDYPLFLTLGPERECHFVTTPKEDGRLLLKAADGSSRVVGAGVRWTFEGDNKVLLNPLAELTADEVKGLWGVSLDAWPEGVEEKLKQIDTARACVTITDGVVSQGDANGRMPALPEGIHYLAVAERSNMGITDYEALGRLTQLRFLMVNALTAKSIDARLLAGNQSLRCLMLRTQALEHPEALSRLSEVERLDLANIDSLAAVEFVSRMPRLRRLDVRGTQVHDLSSLAGLGKLEEVTASTSPVDKLPEGSLPALRRLTVFSTRLTEPAVKAFAERNPKCEVFFRWDEALRQATAKATRLRIRSGGTCHRQLAKEKTLFELKDAAQIRDFVRQIGIVEAESGFECMCCGEPTFEFYQDDKLIAMVGFHHGRSLRWPGHWPGDALLTPQSQVKLPKWLADHGFDALQKAREAELAAQEEERKQRQRLLECYPEGARKLFDVRISPLDDGETKQGKRIAQAVGDPVELALATCRALGVAEGSWSSTDNDQRLILAAGRTVKGDEFLAALKRLRGEQAAELGAARMFFWEGYDAKLDPASRVEWTVHLAPIVLDHGWNENKPILMRRLTRLKDAKITALLHRVAKGEVGHDERGYGEEPRLRPSAYLALAEQGDADIKPGVMKLLAETPEGPDRAALEVSLALLGDAKYIRREHFQYQSYTIGLAAIQAIENFGGREGMDVLVEAGVEHPWHAVDEEAILAVQRITGQTWCKDPEHERVTNYRKEMEKWWREKGAEFVKERRAKAPDGARSGGP